MGRSFVPEAIAKGASAILAKTGADVAVPPGVAVLTAAEPRRALALMAARFYPAQPATIVAVTGTSGKTSVAEFTRQMFAALGRTAASLGTIGLVKPDGSVYGSLTTPDPVSPAPDSGRAGGARASRTWPSRRPRTASTSTGSTACGSRLQPSPTSAATTSTITRPWRPISRPSCGCSRSCCPRADVAVVNADAELPHK